MRKQPEHDLDDDESRVQSRPNRKRTTEIRGGMAVSQPAVMVMAVIVSLSLVVRVVMVMMMGFVVVMGMSMIVIVAVV